MAISVLRHYVVVGLFDHALPVAYIPVSLNDLVDVAEILSDRDIVTVRFKDTVVVALEQNLAGLRPDGFEMTRGDALAGNFRCLPAVEALKNVFEARGPILEQVIMPRAIQQTPAVVQVVGARLRTDQRVAAIQKPVPLIAG